jgi:hypothetical protein
MRNRTLAQSVSQRTMKMFLILSQGGHNIFHSCLFFYFPWFRDASGSRAIWAYIQYSKRKINIKVHNKQCGLPACTWAYKHLFLRGKTTQTSVKVFTLERWILFYSTFVIDNPGAVGWRQERKGTAYTSLILKRWNTQQNNGHSEVYFKNLY